MDGLFVVAVSSMFKVVVVLALLVLGFCPVGGLDVVGVVFAVTWFCRSVTLVECVLAPSAAVAVVVGHGCCCNWLC